MGKSYKPDPTKHDYTPTEEIKARFKKTGFVHPDNLTKEQRHDIAVLGARATAEKRRQMRTLREYLEICLSGKGIKDKDKTICEEMVMALVKQALKGNVKAYQAIEETLGQKQATKVQATVADHTIKVTIEDDDEQSHKDENNASNDEENE